MNTTTEQKIDTTERMLEILRTFFNDDFVDIEERRKLWNVLTALRGPDDIRGLDDKKRFAEKKACVSLIRRAVAGQSFTDFGAYNRFDSEEDAKIRRDMERNNHFQVHMQWAFKALGLAWNNVNNAEDSSAPFWLRRTTPGP